MARPTFINKPALLLSLSLSLLGLAVAGCSGEGKSSAGAAAGAPAAPEVEVVTPIKGTAAITQDLPGRLQAVRTAQVRARVEGIVEKRLFAEGSDVKQGQMLFQIDDRDYQATATSAMVDVEVMKAALQRYEPLLPSKAVSQQEYDQAQVKLMQAQAVYTKAKINLENTKVPAPISGRIGRALVTEGALVGRGEPTHLATIEQIDPIYANFTQSNAELLRLRKAMQAGKLQQTDQAQLELVLEDGSIYPLPGKLEFSDLAVEMDTGAVNLRALFPNPKHELLPGQYVRVRFRQGQLDDILRVPQAAVMASEQGQLVMVVNAENKVTPQPIETAGMSGPDWLVSGGLQGDEKIIIKGLHRARPGSVVQPVSPQAAPDAAATNSAQK